MNKQYQKAERATYNLTTNRFKLWFAEGDRLPDDEYKEARALKMQFFYGQKCFSGIYSPRVEDFILRYIGEIEQDDTPDDVESRVERYQRYAERSEEAAISAQNRQTNTDRQARQAENTAEYEIEKARHWQERVAGAIANAASKDNTGTITRRIKKLEKHARKQTKIKEGREKWVKNWENMNVKDANGKELRTLESAVILARYDRGLPNDADLKIQNGKLFPEDAAKMATEIHVAAIEICDRWLNHLAQRIEYETAYLVAVGGSADMLKPKPRRKTAPPPQDGLKKGAIVWAGFGGQGYLKAEILTLSSLTCRIKFVDEDYQYLNRDPKGHKYGRRFIKQAVPA